MAATGKTPILLYGSTTATNTPSAGNLTNSSDGCEIAINVADKNLFFKDSGNVVNTVPIRQSSGSSNGWLSSTDWTTFNSKQPAGTYVTSVTGTSPVVSSGGTTPAISMPAATSSVNGYLTSTDWSTFNGKQAALGYTPVNKAGDTMTGSLTAPSFIPSSSTVPTNGMYLPSAGVVSIASNSQVGLTINDTGSIASRGSVTIGSSGSYAAGALYSDANWGMIIRAKQASPAQAIFRFADSADTECFRVTTANNLSVTSGNVVIATSGKGIDFSATAGTGTSELLADYEEGTWTPTQGAGLTVVGTFSSSGAYTKIGNMVYVKGLLSATTSIAATRGTEFCAGLPYTALANSVGVCGNAGYTTLTGIRAITTSLYSVVDIAATTSIAFSISYQV